jgi:hypothetical protein
MADETTYYENPVQFSRDWADRLRKARALDDLSDNPIMGADDRYVRDIGETLQQAQREYSDPEANYRPSRAVRDTLANAFTDRQDYLRRLGGEEVRSFGERLEDFETRTGASFSNLSGQDFGGVRHETLSHLLPYDKGFSADYADKRILGQTIGSSPISPLNERLARFNDVQLDTPDKRFTFARLFSDDDAMNILYDEQGSYAAGLEDIGRGYTRAERADLTPDKLKRLGLFEATSQRTNPFLFPSGDPRYPNRMRSFDFGGSNLSNVEAETILNLNEAQRLYESKFTEPLRRRLNNLGLVQAAPEVSRNYFIRQGLGLSDSDSLLSGLGGKVTREFRGLPTEETPYTRLQNLSKNLSTLGDGRVFGSSGADALLFAGDPVTASLEGARRLVKENPRGTLLGSATSLADPEVAKAVARDDYGAAAATVGRDVVGGAVTEALLKQAAKRAPAAAAVLNSPVARLAGPVATGAALFTQGAPGSLTDVITRKAAQNPVSFLPSVKPNPRTDAGARASRWLSNQGRYIMNQLGAGRLPYFGGR